MAIEYKKIIVRKGLQADTPALEEGELGLQTDSKKLIYGVSDGVKGLADSEHTHGNITKDGKIGVTEDLVVVTGLNGELTTATRAGVDSRTSFPPTSHGHTYDSLSGKPTLGTVSPLNIPNNAAKYLKGDGTWGDTPSGLANSEASFTLFSGAVLIETPTTPSVNIPTSVGLLKNAVIRIKFDANGYTNVTQDVAVNASNVATFYDNSLPSPDLVVNFSITFGLTQAVFSAPFDAGECQNYVLREITVMYNK